jgi:type III secretion protein Q
MTPAPACEPLARRLPRVAPGTARLSRLAFDARFEPWLRALLDAPALQVTREHASADSALLTLHTAQGRLELAFVPDDWPGLALALRLPPPHDPCAVADLLLQPLLQRLAPAFTEARVIACDGGGTPRARAQIGLHLPRAAVGLREIDDAMAAHVAAALAAQRPRIGPLKALRLCGRLQLAVRQWPYAVLRSLQPGDTVLLGGANGNDSAQHPPALAPTLFFGVGTTMQASTEIDPQGKSAKLRSAPRVARETGAAADAPPPQAIEELQLPVSFEIDTARIGLGELASMKPGTVIELDAPLLQSAVRLVCHGQTVGQGQLVAVGDQLGVRITRMGLGDSA